MTFTVVWNIECRTRVKYKESNYEATIIAQARDNGGLDLSGSSKHVKNIF